MTTSRSSFLSGLALSALCLGPALTAQVQLVSSVGAASDGFGGKNVLSTITGGPGVAVSGEVAVVGCFGTDFPGEVDQGSATVFRRSGGAWVEEQLLSSSAGGANDRFGSSVAVCGDVIVVGSPFADVVGSLGQGFATVFRWDGALWVEEQTLTASGGQPGDAFGSSVSVNGNVIVVGAVADDVAMQSDQGSATVFRYDGVQWNEEQTLLASGGLALDRFGVSVCVSGTSIVVGAFGDDVAAVPSAGSATVFRWNGSAWAEEQLLTAVTPGSGDGFGRSVSVSGDVVAAGALWADTPGAASSGHVTVFRWDGATWSNPQTLVHPSPVSWDWFGVSVSANGDSVAVGAPFDDVGAKANVGSAFVFRWNGTTWGLASNLMPGVAVPDDRVGASVAIDSDVLLVGAPDTHVGGLSDQGVVYLYTPQWWPWSDQDSALAGVFGRPMMSGVGALTAGSTNVATLSLAAPNATAALFMALGSASVPFKGGTLKPWPFFPLVFLPTSPSGTLPVTFVMPPGVPSGTELWVQWGIQDVMAVQGVALSNALRGLLL